MILRMVRGRPGEGWAPPLDPSTRERLTKAAFGLKGLETVVLGWRDAEIVVVTVWRDVESMIGGVRGADGDQDVLARRLGLAIRADEDTSVAYEVMSRTFALLPADRSVLRLVTIDTKPAAEGALMERLRQIQLGLVPSGLTASHIARRVLTANIEAVVVAIWPDHSTIDAATGGMPERPAGFDQIDAFIRAASVETFDALEIAPRLPMTTGPPILVLDESQRVVDLTPSAAATLGRSQDETLWTWVGDLMSDRRWSSTHDWLTHDWLANPANTDDLVGESGWSVPSGGLVMIRWLLRRHAPVEGRHTLLVRRQNESGPTSDEMDAALAEVFSRDR